MALIGLGVQSSNRTLALDGGSLEIVGVGSKEERRKALGEGSKCTNSARLSDKQNMKPHLGTIQKTKRLQQGSASDSGRRFSILGVQT